MAMQHEAQWDNLMSESRQHDLKVKSRTFKSLLSFINRPDVKTLSDAIGVINIYKESIDLQIKD